MLDIRMDENGRVRLTGRLDAIEANRALRFLDDLQTSIVADLSELDYISSAGLAVFLKTHKRLHRQGLELRLVHLLPRVRSIFEYAGFDRLLQIE